MSEQLPVTLPISISRAVQLMLQQRTKGIAQYGQPVEEANQITVGGWLQHMQEEIADAAVYASMLDVKLGILNSGLRQLSTLIDTDVVEARKLCDDLQVLLAGKVADPAQKPLPLKKPRERATRKSTK